MDSDGSPVLLILQASYHGNLPSSASDDLNLWTAFTGKRIAECNRRWCHNMTPPHQIQIAGYDMHAVHLIGFLLARGPSPLWSMLMYCND
jgi:hypothetical protein